ncbi:MAG: V-type ATP synthase subunit A, partial [Sphaerochaeta sp.]
MKERIVGQVKRVNGPVIILKDVNDAMMMEMVRIGEQQLVGEVVKLYDGQATVQVYEDATGICPGDNVYGSGMSLSVELGPGLIGTIYDGIQRPLEKLMGASGAFISRGLNFPAVDHEKLWAFVPTVEVGAIVHCGMKFGTVVETDRVLHVLMIPPSIAEATVAQIASEGAYTVDDIIVTVVLPNGKEEKLTMLQRWPIRIPRPVAERLALKQPLITGLRVIDTLFPLAKGGTVAIPGGFGTGKTMTQHSIAQWCDADIIVYIGCGERGNEMTDVLREFPLLVDPRTGQSLMERTILIANTSNMPVSAREASIYTGITMAEYYRDQGFHVAIMADSTSRWAEALRELSGRMEEMPA